MYFTSLVLNWTDSTYLSLSVLIIQESMNGTFMSEAAALRVRCSRQQNS